MAAFRAALGPLFEDAPAFLARLEAERPFGSWDLVFEAAGRVAEDLARLNGAYEARFGFRYVIFVAGRPRSAIVPLLDAALAGDRRDELARGLRDVVAIARARAAKLGIEREDDR